MAKGESMPNGNSIALPILFWKPLALPTLAIIVSPLSKKSPRIAQLLSALPTTGHSRHYLGYFACFNQQLYFEAHDVLEELWLADGKSGGNYSFYKGLIQLAGAFVHLQKDRLRPAVALFNLAEANLRPFSPAHLGLDLNPVLDLLEAWRSRVLQGDFEVNPFRTEAPPYLTGPSESAASVAP